MLGRIAGRAPRAKGVGEAPEARGRRARSGAALGGREYGHESGMRADDDGVKTYNPSRRTSAAVMREWCPAPARGIVGDDSRAAARSGERGRLRPVERRVQADRRRPLWSAVAPKGGPSLRRLARRATWRRGVVRRGGKRSGGQRTATWLRAWGEHPERTIYTFTIKIIFMAKGQKGCSPCSEGPHFGSRRPKKP